MIGFATPLFGKIAGVAAPVGPIDPATLFTGGQTGGYWNFTDGATLAVNSDGTGGTPAIGAACRSVLDKSGNGNRLLNNVASSTRRANGIETGGANYGMYIFWGAINQPFEIVACFAQLAYAGVDKRIISGSNASLLQGAASGDIRQFAGGYGATVAMGLNAEKVIDACYDSASSSIAIDGAAMAAGPAVGNAQLDSLVLGSNTGGGDATQIRFKHLLVIGRVLTASERTSVVQWMQA